MPSQAYEEAVSGSELGHLQSGPAAAWRRNGLVEPGCRGGPACAAVKDARCPACVFRSGDHGLPDAWYGLQAAPSAD